MQFKKQISISKIAVYTFTRYTLAARLQEWLRVVKENITSKKQYV